MSPIGLCQPFDNFSAHAMRGLAFAQSTSESPGHAEKSGNLSNLRPITTFEAFEAQGGAHGQKLLLIGLWNIVVVPASKLPHGPEEPALNSRVIKMLSHCVLRSSHFILYIDSKVGFKSPTAMWQPVHAMARDIASSAPAAQSPLANPLGSTRTSAGDCNGGAQGLAAWIAPTHPKRSSTAQEMVCVYLLGMARPDVFAQATHYMRDGFLLGSASGIPRLAEGEWHLRDASAAESVALGERWYEEFIKWRDVHMRDQLSFWYVAWSLAMLSAADRGRPAPTQAALARGGSAPACVASRSFHFASAWNASSAIVSAKLDVTHTLHSPEHRARLSSQVAHLRNRNLSDPRLQLLLPGMPNFWEPDGLLKVGMWEPDGLLKVGVDSNSLCTLGWDALQHLQATGGALSLAKLKHPKLRSFVKLNHLALRRILASIGQLMPNQMEAFFKKY